MKPVPVRVLQLHTSREIRAELERVGADSSFEEKVGRAEFYIVKLERVSLPLARLLYQELIMEGGQVVTAPRLEHVGEGETDVLLCATRYQLSHLVVRLQWQPSDELQLLAGDLQHALDWFTLPLPALEIGAARFDWTRTYLMGILNLTPDSFSGDGLIGAGETESTIVSRAVQRARQLTADGADILDLGGESTHPDAPAVDVETELQRVLPIVRAVKRELSIPLSIDTTKAAVAAAALEAGASLVNDVTGLLGDPEMKHVVSSHQAPVVLMHNWLHRKRPADVGDLIGVMIDELHAQIDIALAGGIPEKNLIVDPGLGFGKTTTENLTLINRLGEFRALGLPILVGPSRKGFIRKTTGVSADECEAGTAAAVTVAILRGANLVRVHNIRAISQVTKMTDAIKQPITTT